MPVVGRQKNQPVTLGSPGQCDQPAGQRVEAVAVRTIGRQVPMITEREFRGTIRPAGQEDVP